MCTSLNHYIQGIHRWEALEVNLELSMCRVQEIIKLGSQLELQICTPLLVNYTTRDSQTRARMLVSRTQSVMQCNYVNNVNANARKRVTILPIKLCEIIPWKMNLTIM